MTDLFTSLISQFTPFTFGAHAVRVMQRDGEPWFVAADVCGALGYKNTTQAVADNLDHDERYICQIDRGGSLVLINESGLYALVLRSRKPEARKFAKWVTGEVLPSIRKTGGYQQSTNVAQALQTSAEVARSVQQVVFDAMLAGDVKWRGGSYLVSFAFQPGVGHRPVVSALDRDAITMSLPQMAIALGEPGGLAPTISVLANLGAAINKQLAQRIGSEAERKALAAT